MHDQKFTYNISRKDKTHIVVHKNVRTAIRIFAAGEGLSIVAATYMIIKTGFETILKMEKEQREFTKLKFTFLALVARARERKRQRFRKK